MAIRNVRILGDEILRKKSKEVEVIDSKVKELIEDMIETMQKENGIGLAAPQVGVLKRVIVIDIGDGNGPIKLINPIITKQKGEQISEEGCLSYPNNFAKVKRPAEVTVEALDEDGDEIKIKAREIMAVVLCHEIDHLDGIVFVDKMIPGTLEKNVENEK